MPFVIERAYAFFDSDRKSASHSPNLCFKYEPHDQKDFPTPSPSPSPNETQNNVVSMHDTLSFRDEDHKFIEVRKQPRKQSQEQPRKREMHILRRKHVNRLKYSTKTKLECAPKGNKCEKHRTEQKQEITCVPLIEPDQCFNAPLTVDDSVPQMFKEDLEVSSSLKLEVSVSRSLTHSLNVKKNKSVTSSLNAKKNESVSSSNNKSFAVVDDGVQMFKPFNNFKEDLETSPSFTLEYSSSPSHHVEPSLSVKKKEHSLFSRRKRVTDFNSLLVLPSLTKVCSLLSLSADIECFLAFLNKNEEFLSTINVGYIGDCYSFTCAFLYLYIALEQKWEYLDLIAFSAALCIHFDEEDDTTCTISKVEQALFDSSLKNEEFVNWNIESACTLKNERKFVIKSACTLKEERESLIKRCLNEKKAEQLVKLEFCAHIPFEPCQRMHSLILLHIQKANKNPRCPRFGNKVENAFSFARSYPGSASEQLKIYQESCLLDSTELDQLYDFESDLDMTPQDFVPLSKRTQKFIHDFFRDSHFVISHSNFEEMLKWNQKYHSTDRFVQADVIECYHCCYEEEDSSSFFIDSSIKSKYHHALNDFSLLYQHIRATGHENIVCANSYSLEKNVSFDLQDSQLKLTFKDFFGVQAMPNVMLFEDSYKPRAFASSNLAPFTFRIHSDEMVCTLSYYLKMNCEGNWDELLDFTRQIIQGVHFLHSQNVFSLRDSLSLSTIFLDKNKNLRLFDPRWLAQFDRDPPVFAQGFFRRVFELKRSINSGESFFVLVRDDCKALRMLFRDMYYEYLAINRGKGQTEKPNERKRENSSDNRLELLPCLKRLCLQTNRDHHVKFSECIALDLSSLVLDENSTDTIIHDHEIFNDRNQSDNANETLSKSLSYKREFLDVDDNFKSMKNLKNAFEQINSPSRIPPSLHSVQVEIFSSLKEAIKISNVKSKLDKSIIKPLHSLCFYIQNERSNVACRLNTQFTTAFLFRFLWLDNLDDMVLLNILRCIVLLLKIKELRQVSIDYLGVILATLKKATNPLVVELCLQLIASLLEDPRPKHALTENVMLEFCSNPSHIDSCRLSQDDFKQLLAYIRYVTIKESEESFEEHFGSQISTVTNSLIMDWNEMKYNNRYKENWEPKTWMNLKAKLLPIAMKRKKVIAARQCIRELFPSLIDFLFTSENEKSLQMIVHCLKCFNALGKNEYTSDLCVFFLKDKIGELYEIGQNYVACPEVVTQVSLILMNFVISSKSITDSELTRALKYFVSAFYLYFSEFPMNRIPICNEMEIENEAENSSINLFPYRETQEALLQAITIIIPRFANFDDVLSVLTVYQEVFNLSFLEQIFLEVLKVKNEPLLSGNAIAANAMIFYALFFNDRDCPRAVQLGYYLLKQALQIFEHFGHYPATCYRAIGAIVLLTRMITPLEYGLARSDWPSIYDTIKKNDIYERVYGSFFASLNKVDFRALSALSNDSLVLKAQFPSTQKTELENAFDFDQNFPAKRVLSDLFPMDFLHRVIRDKSFSISTTTINPSVSNRVFIMSSPLNHSNASGLSLAPTSSASSFEKRSSFSTSSSKDLSSHEHNDSSNASKRRKFFH